MGEIVYCINLIWLNFSLNGMELVKLFFLVVGINISIFDRLFVF